MGHDDRPVRQDQSSAPEKKLQLIGHTKNYTKVVLEQTEEVFGSKEVKGEALIGRCVVVQITEATKWHVTGYVTDLSPPYERVAADYFERLETTRKDALVKSF